MPLYRITLNFGISEKLKDYIRITYGANILTMGFSDNQTTIKANAPNQAALDSALVDIRNKLIEIEEIIE